MPRKILKWAMIVVAVAFVCAQFYRPAMSNATVDPSRTVEARLHVTPEVKAILARSCNDCHSNQTRFPWYSYVAPVSWTLASHIREGRAQLNFSDWASYDEEDQDRLLHNICSITKRGAMPINSYLYIHHDAKLTDADVKTLCDWANSERDRLNGR